MRDQNTQTAVDGCSFDSYSGRKVAPSPAVGHALPACRLAYLPVAVVSVSGMHKSLLSAPPQSQTSTPLVIPCLSFLSGLRSPPDVDVQPVRLGERGDCRRLCSANAAGGGSLRETTSAHGSTGEVGRGRRVGESLE